MNSEEFSATYLGLIPDIEKDEESIPFKRGLFTDIFTDTLSDLPTTINWRNNLPPVKDQKKCGACYTFGAAAVLEGAYSIATGNIISLSE